jgi:hypothetical protein
MQGLCHTEKPPRAAVVAVEAPAGDADFEAVFDVGGHAGRQPVAARDFKALRHWCAKSFLCPGGKLQPERWARGRGTNPGLRTRALGGTATTGRRAC